MKQREDAMLGGAGNQVNAGSGWETERAKVAPRCRHPQ